MTQVGTRAVLYSIVRCPYCDRRIMDVPNDPEIVVRVVSENRASGLGRVVPCKRCGNWIEVIEQ